VTWMFVGAVGVVVLPLAALLYVIGRLPRW
jgi:hypothetical protein